MVNGVLPWRNMEREAAEKCKETADKHMFSTTPREFILIFKHLKKLNYNRTPGKHGFLYLSRFNS